jgi:hypothetical protein
MHKIPYDASRKSLYHPGKAGNFFNFELPPTHENSLCAEMSRLAYVKQKDRQMTYLGRAQDRLMASATYLVKHFLRSGAVLIRKLADHSPINYLSGTAGLRE